MSDEQPDLDASMAEAIRRIPPVDPNLKERQIAAAVAAMSQTSMTGRRHGIARWAAAAAAVVALVGGGFAAGSARKNTSVVALEQNANSDPSNTGSIVKGGAPGQSGDATSATTVSSACDSAIGLPPLTRYKNGSDWRVAYLRVSPSPAIVVVNEDTCTVLEEIDLP